MYLWGNMIPKKNSCADMDSFVKIIERKQTQQGLTFVNAKKDKVHRNIKRIEHRTVQALGKTQMAYSCMNSMRRKLFKVVTNSFVM
jgi:hypothetical protein